MSEYHNPVLLDEILVNLIWNIQGEYTDCTTGGGGHSRCILKKLESGAKLNCLDRDQEALSEAREAMGVDSRVSYLHTSFSGLGKALEGKEQAGFLFDLGVSSHQLDQGDRGFSFRSEAPLDMRMDQGVGQTASELIDSLSEHELIQLFKKWAEVPRAVKLARQLIELKAIKPNLSTSDLRNLINEVYGEHQARKQKIYARVFQALRMKVNSEIEEIEIALNDAAHLLCKNGRMCVISYHSVEDRAVKQTLAKLEKACLCPHELPICQCGGNNQIVKKVNRKPILPSIHEIELNPRARSAKLRVYERV